MKLCDNFSRLGENYLFAETVRRKREFLKREPNADLIDLGIGDVALPIGKSIASAMKRAVGELEKKKTFRGYSPTEGYAFLRNAVAESYMTRGISVSPDEVFVSDGAKGDIVAFTELFGAEKVLICDPSYPAYADAAVLCGKTPIFIRGNEENGFLPLPDGLCGEYIIVLCSPGNPTGAVYSKEALSAWVDYALVSGSVILFDAAYRDFVTDGSPISVFEIDGAEKCAVEICSFSKGAGFTGIRCGWSVVPKSLDGGRIRSAFVRKLSSEKNGVSYISQRGAEAALLPKGREECRENVLAYLKNAENIGRVFSEKNLTFFGGVNSPYLWLRLPDNSSVRFFERLLRGAHIVGTPGVGFGASGEGYFRFSALALPTDVSDALFRLRVFL